MVIILCCTALLELGREELQTCFIFVDFFFCSSWSRGNRLKTSVNIYLKSEENYWDNPSYPFLCGCAGSWWFQHDTFSPSFFVSLLFSCCPKVPPCLLNNNFCSSFREGKILVWKRRTELCPLALSPIPFLYPYLMGPPPLSPQARYILSLHCIMPWLLTAFLLLLLGLRSRGEAVQLVWEWVGSQHCSSTQRINRSCSLLTWAQILPLQFRCFCDSHYCAIEVSHSHLIH